ncbi:hypothetical protein B0H16DRAFT_1715394 [Mycena metata]|uniref:Uncharacterized protein n=1 Tax=Mycena metata TaxID=1033252 RepID=A0AAD7NQE7_9AGAR|nr:hypothetical protein B0H16DRAFT_1715394 [Mycena metata]
MDMPYESTSSFLPTFYGGLEGSVGRAEYSPHFTNLPSPHRFGYPSDSSVTYGQVHRREEFAAHGGGSVGARYYDAHDSINDSFPAAAWPVGGDLSRAHSMVDEDMFRPQPQPVVFGSSQPGHAQHSRHYGAVERNYRSSYHTMHAGRPAQATSAAQPSRPHSPVSERPASRQHLPRTIIAQDFAHDFVHMNDAFISTDLPADSPFALVPADRRESFPGHPYPDSHQWPQTFKITEVKQIGPKKQVLACFFCRSRKIACAPKPVDAKEDRSCEYVV